MPPLNFRQTHFRFLADDGPPDSMSPLAPEDANLVNVAKGAHFLLRAQLQRTATDAQGIRRQLEYRPRGSGNWFAAPDVGVNYDAPFTDASTWFTEGASLALQRLTTPSDATSADYIGGEAQEKWGTLTSTLVYDSKQFSEDLFCLRVPSLCADGADWEFRIATDSGPVAEYQRWPRLIVTGAAPTEMDLLANQLFASARPLARLEFWRDNAWRDLSARLLFPITVYRRLKAVATAELRLDNSDGLLARDNLISSWNYNVASSYDPLLDENRKVCLQQGLELHPNLALGLSYGFGSFSPTRPESATGVELTEGGFGQAKNELDSAWVGWEGQTATIVFTLSPPRFVKGVAASLLSRAAANVLLPSSASVTLVSTGGSITHPLAVDHLRDDRAGRRHCLFGLDLDRPGVEQVLLDFHPQSGSPWIQLDEVAIFDASTTADYYRTTFTGLLGDEITTDAGEEGVVSLSQVRDASKRLADLFIEVYDHYRDQTVEQIIADLLTNEKYGAALSSSDFDLEATQFTLPKWTEQNVSLLDACCELAKMIGWVFEADEEGIYRLHDLDWTSQTGDRVFLADRDLGRWSPVFSGLNLRNKILVKSRDARNKEIQVLVQEEASIERYGPRLFTLFEPSLRSAPAARQLANALRRDYAWILPCGAGEARGDLLLRPGQVVTVVESARTFSRSDLLYRVEAITHRQTGHRFGEHSMRLELRGYRYRAPVAPSSLTATPMEQAASLNWVGPLEDPTVAGFLVYQANSFGDSYSAVSSVGSPPTIIPSLTNAQTYWFKVAAYTADEVIGDKAGPVPCAPQSGGAVSQAEIAWQPQSLVGQAMAVWAEPRPQLRWSPRQPPPFGTGYNIYRSSQASLGPFDLVSSKYQTGMNYVYWVDFTTNSFAGPYWYRVTYYNPSDDFESIPSTTVVVSL